MTGAARQTYSEDPKGPSFGHGSPDLIPIDSVQDLFQPVEIPLCSSAISRRGFQFIAFDDMLMCIFGFPKIERHYIR